jgi:hypothetical protein
LQMLYYGDLRLKQVFWFVDQPWFAIETWVWFVSTVIFQLQIKRFIPE